MPSKIHYSSYIILFLILVVGIFSSIKLPSPGSHLLNEGIAPDDHSDFAASVPDTMSFAVFKPKLDSIGAQDWCEKSKLLSHGKGLYGSFVGFTVITEPDNCVPGKSMDSYLIHDKRYLALPGYNLRPSSRFHISEGKYYLQSVVRTPDSPSAKNQYMEKEIPVRFAGNHLNYHEKGMVLIPVSNNNFRLVKIMTWIVVSLIPICIVAFIIILPLLVFFSLCRQKVFTKANARNLHITGWTLVALALVPGLLSILLSFVFGSKIPGEIYLPVQGTLLQHSTMLMIGLAVLLFAGAFRRGYKLQKEIDTFY